MTNKQAETPALVSVIVPCHNYGHFLSETLDSLIAQTYQHWECLVIDNGSEDNTVEIAKQYMQTDKRFVVYSIPLSTTSRTRNFGIARSKGQFVLFLDSDDQIAPFKLEKSIKIFVENADVSLVYSPSRYYDSGKPEVLRSKMNDNSHLLLSDYEGDSRPLLEKMITGNLFTICAPVIRKEAVFAINGFNDSLNWVEDWDFYIRLLASGIQIKECASEDAASLIRVHNRSLSKRNMNMMEQSIVVRKNLNKVLSKIKINGVPARNLKKANNLQIRFLHRSLFSSYLKQDNFRAFEHLFAYFLLDRNIKVLLKGSFGLLSGKNVFEKNSALG